MDFKRSAKEIMSRPVRKLMMDATVREAASFLLRWGISGAVVVDGRNRPMGVFSLKDLARHTQHRLVKPEDIKELMDILPQGEVARLENIDMLTVMDLMSPGIVSVASGAPMEEVVATMSSLHIHRVFVLNAEGELVGVITSMDVMRWLDRSFKKDRRQAERVRL